MVAPPSIQILVIRDTFGNMISLNQALLRIEQLRNIINEYNNINFVDISRRERLDYLEFADELELLENQIIDINE